MVIFNSYVKLPEGKKTKVSLADIPSNSLLLCHCWFRLADFHPLFLDDPNEIWAWRLESWGTLKEPWT